MTATVTTVFPCDNCICVPICRHKTYSKLFDDCSLLYRHIDVKSQDIGDTSYITVDIVHCNHVRFRYVLQTYLNPTTWEINDKGIFITLRKDLTP